MDYCFSVHNLEKFSSNPVKVHFEGLVHLLIYIGYKPNLVLIYDDNIEDSTIYDLLIQDDINIYNHFMVLYDYIWQDCPDNVRSTGAYIVFYQGILIDHLKHVPGPVA